MNTKAKNIMSRKLVDLPAGSSLKEAQELMREKRIRHLPIIDKDAEIIGVLSESDLNTTLDPENTPVEMVMSGRIELVHQEAPLRSTILKMLEKKVSSLLICNDAKEAVGIITTDDLLWYLAHTLEKEKERSTLMALLDIQTLNQAAYHISNAGL